MTVGETLRIMREIKGYSQSYIGLSLHVDQTTIGRYERGQTDPPISVVLHICKLCGACISQFEGCDLPPLPGTKHRNKKEG